MPNKSTKHGYGRVAVVLHWISALLILGMFPLGFLMQDAGEDGRLICYRLHVTIGFVVLLLTVARLLWKFFDVKPDPPVGLTGNHLRGMELIHVLLYAGLLVLAVSGIVLNIQSGFIEVLSGKTQAFPDFAEFQARRAHRLLARLYIGLLVAHIGLLVVHIGGVVVHQFRHGNVFARIGIGKSQIE